jgi:predicted HTH transcriptional regulator
MITQITIDEVKKLIKTSPEQAIFDWKSDFALPNDDDKRGELIKDISAIANAITTSYGFIIYGVDPRRSDPILGISARYDDAKIQQLIKGKIEPPVKFLYYEVTAGPRAVGVLQIIPTRSRPHIIRADIGKVRKGQIVIREVLQLMEWI